MRKLWFGLTAVLAMLFALGISLAFTYRSSSAPEASRVPTADNAAPALSSASLPPCPSCNVILVTVDTLRADFLECLGGKADTMPNLCDLARRARLYERAISPAPATLPALSSLMTGRIISNESLFERLTFYQNAPYAAQSLRASGYETAAVVDHPAMGSLEKPGRQSGFLQRGFAQFENFGVLGAGDTGSAVSAAAVSFLETHSRQRFFLWLHYFGPHFPYSPSEQDAVRLGYKEEICGRVGKVATIEELRRLKDTITDGELECARNLYRAELFRVDAWIAEVLESLSTLGLWDKTLLVVTADHGEEFLERGDFGHERTVFEELVHVPLVAVHPAERTARRIAEPVSTTCIFDWLTGVMGREPLRSDREVVTRTHHDYRDNQSQRMRSEPNSFAMYDSCRKAVQTRPGESIVVYDLSVDPAEKIPLAVHGPAAADLAGRLDAFVQTPQVVLRVEDNTDMRDLLRLDFDRLEKLGYFE